MFSRIWLCVCVKIFCFPDQWDCWIWWSEFFFLVILIEVTVQCVIAVYRQGSRILLVHFLFLSNLEVCSWPAFSFLTASFLVVCYCGWFTARVNGSRVEDQAGCGSCSWEANHFAFIGRLVSTLRCFCKFRNDTFSLFLFLTHGFNL
jgi:hypothetical protein